MEVGWGLEPAMGLERVKQMKGPVCVVDVVERFCVNVQRGTT